MVLSIFRTINALPLFFLYSLHYYQLMQLRLIILFIFFFQVQHLNSSVYKRIRDIISNKHRKFFVFSNEHHRLTAPITINLILLILFTYINLFLKWISSLLKFIFGISYSWLYVLKLSHVQCIYECDEFFVCCALLSNLSIS